MSFFYFFKNDGACRYMLKEILTNFPKYLHGPVEIDGSKKKLYTILKWVQTKTRGANQTWLDEIGINYVKTVDDLPPESGVYITGYDADLEEVKQLRQKNIPIIDHPCPWIKELRRQLLNINSETHQCVLMIDKDHMVHTCYKSAFPEDIIIVQAENYEEKLRSEANGKPFHLLVYAAHREKDAIQITDFINREFVGLQHELSGYKKTLCCWSKQGLMEEIEDVVSNHSLQEIWIVCSSEGDRSTMSIINQVKDCGAKPVIIKNEKDIPTIIQDDLRVGVLLAPIPLSKKVRNIINTLRRKYGNRKELLKILYEAFVMNKVEEIVNDVTEDLVWTMEGVRSVVPIAGVYHGRDGLRKFFKTSKTSIRALEFEILDYTDGDNDKVFVRIYEEGEALSTGKTFKTNMCHEWTFNEELKIKEFHSYNNTHALYEAFSKT